MPFGRPGGGGGDGGGLHFRRPADVFADAAARTLYFGTTDSTAYLNFVNDEFLAVIIGTLAIPTDFQTYTGDDSAYDDSLWVSRTDAVQGGTGASGSMGAPGGGAIDLLGVFGMNAILATQDDIWLDMGFDWPTDSDWIAFRRTDANTTGATGSQVQWMAGALIYGDDAPTAGVIGALGAAAQRRQISDLGTAGNVFVGRNAAGRALMEFSTTHTTRREFTFYKYVSSEVQSQAGGVSEARVQQLIDATSLSALQGQLTDGQIPAAIMRDVEFTASAVRTLLGLTAAQVNDLFTGATIAGQVITYTQADGTTVSLTIPSGGGGMADGVVASGAFNATGTELILTLADGTEITISVPAILRGGGGTPTHASQYLAVGSDSTDQTFVAADFTGALGVDYADGAHTAVAPTVDTNRYFALARLATDPTPTFLDLDSTGVNQIGGLTMQVGTLVIDGDTHNWWLSNNANDISAALVEFR